MTISFLVNEVAGGWGPNSKRLGGTEESIVEWAKRIADRGHKVMVYNNGEHGLFDNVAYIDRNFYTGGDGITINVKSSDVSPQETTWYLTNETNADQLDLSRYEGVIFPSRWAVLNIPVNNHNVVILPHGYNANNIYPSEKVKNQVLYSASPDRGLDELKAIWPIVAEQVPDAKLMITYGATGELPQAEFLGSVSEQEMDYLFRTSDIWVHPCSGGELFGMNAVKAQVAGCIPVYYPTMALSETVKVGVRTDSNRLIDDLVDIMSDEARKVDIRRRLSDIIFPDWDETTAQLLKIIGA